MVSRTSRREAYRVGSRYRGFIARAQAGLCASCGLPLNLARHTKPSHADYPTMDHLVARSRGGVESPFNKVVMHRKCNGRKGSRLANGCELIWLEVVRSHLADMSIRSGSDAG